MKKPTDGRAWARFAIGTKRTFNRQPAMSAFGGKADITVLLHVCLFQLLAF
jgi:hypothetical protein